MTRAEVKLRIDEPDARDSERRPGDGAELPTALSKADKLRSSVQRQRQEERAVHQERRRSEPAANVREANTGREHGEALPADPFSVLIGIGQEVFAAHGHRPQVEALWWPRFVSIAAWFAAEEQRRRAELRRVRGEIVGRIDIAHAHGSLELRARADRIEAGHDGRLTVVDYKTGTAPGNREVQLGLRPQLVLEAVIARAGGFPGVDATAISGVEFWELKGGEQAGRIAQPVSDAAAAADAAYSGVRRLVEHFADPSTAYVPVPRPEIAPSFNDYDHLSRIDEWRGTKGPA